MPTRDGPASGRPNFQHLQHLWPTKDRKRTTISADEQWPIPVDLQQPSIPNESPRDDRKRHGGPPSSKYSGSKTDAPNISTYQAVPTVRGKNYAGARVRQPSEAPIAVDAEHWSKSGGPKVHGNERAREDEAGSELIVEYHYHT